MLLLLILVVRRNDVLFSFSINKKKKAEEVKEKITLLFALFMDNEHEQCFS
jgi:hypothetical protein